ncbi:hypothetical protein C8J57DRAFT_1482311 [Mycena rebaudengoi]|nr:hypothetical protein C8J57DRAFT_1482311 [Mycena rebaudengoi]
MPHGVAETSVVCPIRRSSATNPEQRVSNEQILFTETLSKITLLRYNSCNPNGIYRSSDYKPSFINHPFVSRSILPPKSHFFQAVRGGVAINGPLLGSHSITELTHPPPRATREPIIPATGFIEILLEAGAHFLWDVEFEFKFSLSVRNSQRMVLEHSENNWSIMIDLAVPVNTGKTLDMQPIWDHLPMVKMEAYQKIVRCHGGRTEVISEVKGPSSDEPAHQYRLHPAMPDVCLHMVLPPAISKQFGNEGMYFPSKLVRFVYYGSGETKSYDIVVTDASGAVICEFGNLIVQKLTVHAIPVRRRVHLVFQPISVPPDTVTPLPQYSTCEHQPDEQTLSTILAPFAVSTISKTLERNVAVASNCD